MLANRLTHGDALPIHRAHPVMFGCFCQHPLEPVAQLVERLTFNEDVHGSNPCGLTIPFTSVLQVKRFASPVQRSEDIDDSVDR